MTGIHWQAYLLGGLRVRGAGGSAGQDIEQFQTYKTGALFAYLAYFPGGRHPREMLASLLWPDAKPDSARNRLTQALVWLRPRLEPEGRVPRGSVLFADRGSIGLESSAVLSDVASFGAALQEAATVGPSAAAAEARAGALRRAAAAYSGELLPGYYEDWVIAERRQLHEAFLSALRQIGAHHESTGEFDPALDYARQALAADPLREETHCDLIRLLARTGETAAALRQYRELERVLVEDLGEEPSPEARSLVEQIRREANARPAGRTGIGLAPAAAAKLPASLTRFFGRAAEVEGVPRLIREERTRLVTLIGAGGCGKTRLAVEVARGLADHYDGAVWFVPLADVRDAHRIPNAIAEAVRLSGRVGTASVREQVIDWLGWRPSLLVLDNLEHLAEDGAALLIRELLERAPALTILVTSRQRLGIAGEREVPVPPLPVPAGEAGVAAEDLMAVESIQLFVDRARAVRPAFEVTGENAHAVAQLCARLEGVPLAIELCAAWAQTLTPAQMLAQMTPDPFDLLVSRDQSVPARHRSLRAALEYSYRQLPPDLQRFFSGLSAFRTGWTLEAAHAVCRDGGGDGAGQDMAGRPMRTLDLLTRLRERSLIVAGETGGEIDAPPGAMRYRMLETLREFAAEQRDEETRAALLRRHAAFYLHAAEGAERCLGGAEQAAQMRWFEAEHDNLRAALGWAVENGAEEVALRLAGATAAFWDALGYLGEGRQWLGKVLALSAPPDGLRTEAERARAVARAKALTALGNLARNQGHSPEVDAAMEEAVLLWKRLGDDRGVTQCLQIQATIAYSREDVDTARGLLQKGLRLARRLQDPPLLARSLMNRGNFALAQGKFAQAADSYAESLALYRAEGDRNRVALVLNNLSLVGRYRGEYAAARILLRESEEIKREFADRAGVAVTLLNQGTLHRLEGDHDEARRLIEESGRWAAEAGDKRLLPWCVRELGHLSCARGEFVAGVRLLAAAESQRLSMGISFKPADPPELESAAARARAALGESGFAAAWATGSALPRARIYAETLRLFEG